MSETEEKFLKIIQNAKMQNAKELRLCQKLGF